jgi:hypothetical protein
LLREQVLDRSFEVYTGVVASHGDLHRWLLACVDPTL